MKNWYGIKADGSVGSIESRATGWPDDLDWDDPATTDTRVTILRQKRNDIGITKFQAWDCGCDPALRVCDCHNMRVAEWRVDGDLWVAKPTTEIVVAGATLTISPDPLQFVTAPANTLMTFKVTGPVPDGKTVALAWSGIDPLHDENPLTLTFNNGETQEVSVSAPLLGGITRVGIVGSHVRPQSFLLRGV